MSVRNGIFITPGVVRIAVGTMAVMAVAAVWAVAPEVWRYIKLETM